MATLEARLLIAESTLEIMRLKSLYASYAYGKYTDDHRKKPAGERDMIARQQAECFTEDGEFDAGPVGGQARGRAALFENFRTATLGSAVTGADTQGGYYSHPVMAGPVPAIRIGTLPRRMAGTSPIRVRITVRLEKTTGGKFRSAR